VERNETQQDSCRLDGEKRNPTPIIRRLGEMLIPPTPIRKGVKSCRLGEAKQNPTPIIRRRGEMLIPPTPIRKGG